MGRNGYFAIAVTLLGCGQASTTPTSPTPVTVPAPSASSAPPAATVAKEPDFDLAIGEAIELEGAALPGPVNPTSDAIDVATFSKGRIVVTARATGLATLHFTDPAGGSQTRTFRITETTCRKEPLHPAIVMTAGDRAVIEGPGVMDGIALPRQGSVAATAHFDGERIQVHAQRDGHATIYVLEKDRTGALYDVFVGPACADRHYASVVSPIPPGQLGPKGDGACQRVDGKRTTPAPCPDLSSVERLPKEAFSSLACEWIGACQRQGEEGCCVGCTNPFAMKLDRGCALRALRQKTCADVQKIVDAKGCLH